MLARLVCGSGVLAIVLGCSGLPEVPGLSGSAKGAAGSGKPTNIGVGASSIGSGKGGSPTAAAFASEHIEGRFIVKVRGGAKTEAAGTDGPVPSVLKGFGSRPLHGAGAKDTTVSGKLGIDRTMAFAADGKSLQQIVAQLGDDADVEWVEPVIRMRAASAAKAPNDPHYNYQWHLAAVKAEAAWATTKGKGVVVAVVDTGVSVNEDGLLHLLPGKDFVDMDDDASDENGHGTHVAGTIAQQTNNGIGVAGVAPEASILPVRVLGADGSGTNEGVSAGIVWAVDQGAQVINLSLGSASNSQAVADAVAYAYERGVTVVAATGNDGYTDGVGYPAALDTPIAVGAVDFANVVSFYSNQGPPIDIVGPGGDTSADKNGDGFPDGVIQETFENGAWSYLFFQGTSMATPHVAGVAALVVATGVIAPDDVRERLLSSSTDLGDRGADTVYGAGMVDAERAVAGGRQAGRGPRGGDESAAAAVAAGDAPAAAPRLDILTPTVTRNGAQKVTIRWKTSVPASTLVRGTGGFKHQDQKLSLDHEVVVPAPEGGAVEKFEIGGMAGGAKASKQVSVTK